MFTIHRTKSTGYDLTWALYLSVGFYKIRSVCLERDRSSWSGVVILGSSIDLYE